MRTTLVAVAMLCGTTGCAAPTKDLTAAFDEKEFVWSLSPGTAAVRGQAFAKTYGGDVKPCAGNEIVLVPETTYTREVGIAIQDGYRNITAPPPAYSKYRRTTIGDVMGNFEFTGLPAGSWYVSCRVSWAAACSGLGGCQWTGAWIERKISLKDGEQLKVIVTPDTVPREKPDAPVKKCPSFPWIC